MGLAEGVAARDQRDGFLIVHRHATEGFADVRGCRDRVRLAVRPFRIDVDKAHLNRAERLGKLAFAAVALVAEPGPLRAPVELFRLPDVLAPAAEAESLEAHRFEGDVAGEDHQIGPGELAAVFLLNRPQQPARLVEIGVVGPAIQRRETLLAGAGAAAAVGDAIGAGAVPGHPDHQTAIMAEISRPPVLGIRHQGVQVRDNSIQIEAFELLGVIEILAHRVGERRVLVENLNVELVRPPVAVPPATSPVRNGALGLLATISVHGLPPIFEYYWTCGTLPASR